MHTKDYDRLKDILCEEVEKIAKKGELSAGSLDTVHKLTDTIKNIDKIQMLEDDDDYSEDGGMWRAEGGYGGSSYARGRVRGARRDSMGRYSSADDDMSYANRRGTHYVRGHYSRDDGKDYMIEQIEDLMEDADTKSKEALKRAIKQIENA